MAESLGGFFLHLGIKQDKSSFDAGTQALKGFENLAKNVTKALGLTSGSMLTLAKAAGAVETANLRMSRSIGISTSSLDSWKISAGIAGTSANGLISSMQQVENKMQRIKTGQVDMTMASNLSRMNIGYSEFGKMNAEQRLRSVFSAAGIMEDQKLAATLIGDTLGQSAREYYEYLQLSGKSLDRQLAEGRALNFTTEDTKKQAAIFNAEFNAVAQAGKSITMFFGSNLAAQLTPAVTKIKETIVANKELIQSGIVEFTRKIGMGIQGIIGITGKIAPMITGLIDKFGGLDKIILKMGIGLGALKLSSITGKILSMVQGVNILKLALGGIGKGLLTGGLFLVLEDIMVYLAGGESLLGDIISLFDKDIFKGATKSITSLAESIKNLLSSIAGSDTFKKALSGIVEFLGTAVIGAFETTVVVISDFLNIVNHLLNREWKEAWEATKDLGVDFWDNTKKTFGIGKKDSEKSTKSSPAKVNDGIIRPDGTVTQVAADDWVIATRNLGDLAAGFIPAAVNNTTMNNGGANYVVTQNITVNGSRDLAQTVRMQAYHGATQGLQQTAQKANRTLQQMPGTR